MKDVDEFSNGELLSLMIPAGCWKALKLHAGVEYALMVSVLTDRVIIGAGEEFVKKYAHSSVWATPEFLTELIDLTLLKQ